jgi:3-deoxy-D-manno-octulosonic-acid transferase
LQLLYTFSIFLYTSGIRIAAAWNPKARLWIEGRKGLFNRLENAFRSKEGKTIWMHCASLGEFEQGRPLLEAIREAYPKYTILLTFFSPSGYEIRKNYAGADLVFYLPPDSPVHAKKFIQATRPALAIFIKYEFWYHYLTVLKSNNIPTLLVSAIFRKNQPFFKPYGGFWRQMLDCYNRLFVQDTGSFSLLEAAGFAAQTTVSGDTRFDRVIAVAQSNEGISAIADFCGQNDVIVAGSTWIEDEEILDHYANNHPEIKFIIAPHEIDEPHIRDLEKLFRNSIRFSELSSLKNTQQLKEKIKGKNILVMNNMGMLSKLYRYATITYIGGGFGGAGIHNILEAVVYGKPVLFGPVNEKSREAQQLQDSGAAFTIHNALELESLLDELIRDKEKCQQLGKIASGYVQQESGATRKIMDYIQENRLLTN